MASGGKISIADLTKFSWKPTRFSVDKLYIDVLFENPLFYSQGKDAYDLMQIEVMNDTFNAVNKTYGEKVHSNETLII